MKSTREASKSTRDWGQLLKDTTEEAIPRFTKRNKPNHTTHEPEIPKTDTAEVDLVFGNELTEFANQARQRLSRENFECMLDDLFGTIESKAA
jgi:hypothetical protein